MALVPQTLALQIQQAMQNALSVQDPKQQAAAMAKFANDLALAIDAYIRTAQVNVNTVVTGTAGTFPVVGTGIGTGTLV